MLLSIFQNFTTITENKPFPDILTDIKSGKDYTRLCFMSLDPDLYHYPNSQVFTNTLSSKNSKEESMPIIQNQSQLDGKMEPNGGVKPKSITQQDFLKIYHDSIKLNEHKESFTTGNRNNFVHQLACNLNRKGAPFAAALGFSWPIIILTRKRSWPL